MLSPEPVTFRLEAGLAVITLNRSDRMNAITSEMLELLAQKVPALVTDIAVRALLITGSGKAFCAGGDVQGLGPSTPEATLKGMRRAQDFIRALRLSDKPVITAVNGAAAGGGFGVALLGDIVLASQNAFFKGGFAALGAAPDYGLAFTLPKAVGGLKAAEILLLDQRLNADEALRIGLVNQVLAPEGFADQALVIGRKLAGLSRGGQLARRLLRTQEREALEAFFEAEAQAQSEAFQSGDFAEGLAAFKEKRTARFTGA